MNGDWTAPDAVWFSDRVVDRQFVALIKTISWEEEEGITKIGVSLIDTTHPTMDTYVEKELVEEGKAAMFCL